MRQPLLLLAVLSACAASHGQVVIDSVRFGYTGNVTQYATLDDALAGANAIAIGTVPQRDLGITIVVDAPWYSANCNFIGTSWNYISNTDGRTPSNTNLGFVQLGDLDASTLTSIAASWSTDLSTYRVDLTGVNATSAQDYARLWNAPATSGPAHDTSGTFLSYEMHLTLGGLNAVWDAAAGTYVSAGGDPTSISGTFSGVFQNTSTVGAGYYTFTLDLNLNSWAYDHRNDLAAGSDSYYSSTTATGTVIPEPATAALWLATAAGGFVLWRRRRACAVSAGRER